ncbi:MAG: cupin domain-containing protein [Gammaproteobacteria bacterium]|nr:cupin domain-containing protein [Gammaproteobacteria bacterium]MDH5303629.1 cupin domain-containing protein [Gammaproteobacteria bacterium]MDH5321083.1 cupin domain-containing protein [Gammaproteobacteria bacterium]
MKSLVNTLLVLSSLLLALPSMAREPLPERIASTDPGAYRVGSGAHQGAGEIHYDTLIPGSAFTTNFNFVHRGFLPPGGGIGHHFHNQMEEMYFILDGEAEFTINGRTSTIKGPAAVPCRMGDSHAILNVTDKPVQWMNIAVTTRKGIYDNFDLGDDRVGAAQDKVPVFVNARFDKSLLQPMPGLHGGTGTAFYRRALNPDVFFTNWSYVDHLVLPEGVTVGKKRHANVEEIYYIQSGAGMITVNDETAPISKDDALVIPLNDVHSIANTGDSDLQILIIGAVTQKWMLDTIEME